MASLPGPWDDEVPWFKLLGAFLSVVTCIAAESSATAVIKAGAPKPEGPFARPTSVQSGPCHNLKSPPQKLSSQGGQEGVFQTCGSSQDSSPGCFWDTAGVDLSSRFVGFILSSLDKPPGTSMAPRGCCVHRFNNSSSRLSSGSWVFHLGSTD